MTFVRKPLSVALVATGLVLSSHARADDAALQKRLDAVEAQVRAMQDALARVRADAAATFVLLALLVISGFAPGYLGGGDQRVWIARAHWAGGFAGAVLYILHRLRGPATRPPS
ncbi:MAG TPA: hypothetical protein VIH36_02400 [Casimicrobiaceae bacterium]|jgi:hypothetical protein